MNEQLILAALLLPLATAALVAAAGRAPDVRDTLFVVGSAALAVIAFALLAQTSSGRPPTLSVGEPLSGVGLAFELEPLGAVFAAMSAGLAAVNALFAVGYMRGRNEKNQTRFYIFLSLAMTGAMGVAAAANLFTLFIFYEVITLSTYPLVVHKDDARSHAAGRIYAGVLVGASVALLLPGVIMVHVLAGATDFTPGGVLAGRVGPGLASVILVLLVMGTAKAALVPLHGWLPAAMVAPTPVSALLHAVVVVKAGVFVILKVALYTLGPDLIAEAPAAQWLLWLAAASIVFAGVMALSRDEIKSRLAWSTVGQLACVTGAALIPAASAAAAGGLHMLAHAFAKIALFMCAGAIYVAAGLDKVSEMNGLGRRLPLVWSVFLVASLSIIGLPPLGGMWSKLMLMQSALTVGEIAYAAALVISSLLSAIYLGGPAVRALLPPQDGASAVWRVRTGPSYRLILLALLAAAAAALALFGFAGSVTEFLARAGGVA
jgi:multicomponent Na+:H+ antiporter subunit D